MLISEVRDKQMNKNYYSYFSWFHIFLLFPVMYIVNIYMTSSSCDPMPVEQVLTDFDIEVINNHVLIAELPDIYLVMNMPNLKSAKFIFINLDLSKMLDIRDRDTEIQRYRDT